MSAPVRVDPSRLMWRKASICVGYERSRWYPRVVTLTTWCLFFIAPSLPSAQAQTHAREWFAMRLLIGTCGTRTPLVLRSSTARMDGGLVGCRKRWLGWVSWLLISHILFIRFLGAVICRLIFKPGEEFVRYVDPYPVADEHESDGDTFWHGLVSFRFLFE